MVVEVDAESSRSSMDVEEEENKCELVLEVAKGCKNGREDVEGETGLEEHTRAASEELQTLNSSWKSQKLRAIAEQHSSTCR